MTAGGIGRIGICGCGRMGAGMLRNLLAAGIDVRGFDIRPPSAFGELPVTDDMAAFMDGLDVLVSVVRDRAQTDAALFDAEALLAKGAPRFVVISSTLSPRDLPEIAARLPGGVTLVDAPMSGAQARAEAGTLSFMLGGPDEALDALAPLWSAMGSHAHRMGPLGAGMTAKVLNNMMAAAAMASTRLALDWAAAAGLDRRAFLALAETSSGRNWFTGDWDGIEFAAHGFDPENSVGILAKDVRCALGAAPEGADTSLPELLERQIRALRPTALD